MSKQARRQANKQSLTQAKKKAHKDGQREKEKFYAWLGDILSTGMSQEDFNKARAMFEQGISADIMKASLIKPYKRPK